MLQPNKNKSTWQTDKQWLENWYNSRKLPDSKLNADYQAEKNLYKGAVNNLTAPNFFDQLDSDGSLGGYDSKTGNINLLKGSPQGVYTHEGTHKINIPLKDTQSSNNAFGIIGDNILPQDNVNNQWVKDNYDELSNYQEVIGRLNPYRQKYNLKPDQVITPELIKSNRELYNNDSNQFEDNTDQLYKLFDDEGLSNVLNSVVLNDDKSDTQVAKFGGKIKNMKKNNKIPKYAFGNAIENPATALYQNQIALAKAKQAGDNNGWAKGFQIFGNLAQQVGGSMMNSKGASTTTLSGEAPATEGFGGGINSFMSNNQGNVQSGLGMMGAFSQFLAMGGTVPGMPVEVEGNEVGETPDGTLLDFQGPSHENGGMKGLLPEGTEIYSDRIKVDGITMADRKKKREKRSVRLEDLFETNSTDGLIKNALNRTKVTNEIEETNDNKIQEVVKNLLDKDGVQKYAYGDTVGPDFPRPAPGGEFEYPSMFNMFNGMVGNAVLPTSEELGFNYGQPTSNPFLTGQSPVTAPNTNAVPGAKTNAFSNLFSGITAGDAVGLAGNLVSTFGPMKNTQANRAGDTPNINAFENFGQNGLQTLDQSKQYINQIREQQLKDLALARTSSVRRNNNSARGINTQRALNLATDAQINNAEEQTYNSFAESMLGILSQQAGMQNQIDGTVMQGEQARDLADRQDRDNYFSQLGVDIANKGYGLQETGKDLNQLKENKVTMNLINQLSAYGITVDEKGNLSSKNKKK